MGSSGAGKRPQDLRSLATFPHGSASSAWISAVERWVQGSWTNTPAQRRTRSIYSHRPHKPIQQKAEQSAGGRGSHQDRALGQSRRAFVRPANQPFRTADPAQIIPGGRLEEERWHSRFASLCLGGEWFLSSPGLRAAIDEAIGCPEESNARTATVNVRLEPKLKEEAEHILKTLD